MNPTAETGGFGLPPHPSRAMIGMNQTTFCFMIGPAARYERYRQSMVVQCLRRRSERHTSFALRADEQQFTFGSHGDYRRCSDLFSGCGLSGRDWRAYAGCAGIGFHGAWSSVAERVRAGWSLHVFAFGRSCSANWMGNIAAE